MYKNENGITLIVGLLIVLTISTVSFAGWYVMNANKEEKDSARSSQPEPEKKVEQKPSAVEDTRKQFSSAELPFSFKYPGDWAVKDDGSTAGAAYSITVEAPGTKTKEIEIGGITVEKGAQINIRVYSGIPNNNVTSFKKSGLSATYGENKKDIVIDGRQGLEYNLSYEGPAIHSSVFFDKNVRFDIVIEQDEYANQAYAKIYNDLISSIKFK